MNIFHFLYSTKQFTNWNKILLYHHLWNLNQVIRKTHLQQMCCACTDQTSFIWGRSSQNLKLTYIQHFSGKNIGQQSWKAFSVKLCRLRENVIRLSGTCFLSYRFNSKACFNPFGLMSAVPKITPTGHRLLFAALWLCSLFQYARFPRQGCVKCACSLSHCSPSSGWWQALSSTVVHIASPDCWMKANIIL